MLRCRWPTTTGPARPARLVCGHIRAAAPRRRQLPSAIALGRYNSSKASSTAPVASTSSPRDTLSSLLASFSDPAHNSITADAAWQGRIARALQDLQGPSGGPRNQILLLRPRPASSHSEQAQDTNDLLSCLTQDALQDPQGKAALLLHQARTASGSAHDAVSTTRLVYAREIQADATQGIVAGPWPLIKDVGASVVEVQTSNLDSPDVHSHIYASSQIGICLPYAQLFAPVPAPWLQDAASLIRTFQDHPGFRVVVTHAGQAASADAATSARETIRSWLGVPDAIVDFVDVATAQRAQEALRGAMGLPPLQSTEGTATPSSDRSSLWTRFQTLSQQSGLPTLVSNLVEAEQRVGKLAGVASPTEEGDVPGASSASTSSPPHLSLLSSHATQHRQSRLSLARSDYDALLSLSAHLISSAQSSSLRLTQQILASVQDDLLRPPSSTAATASHEPPLLPAWWKMPFMGDARVRERVQASFEREWLGGKGVEERLIWWAGRVSDVARREKQEMRRLVESLAASTSTAATRERARREDGGVEGEIAAGSSTDGQACRSSSSLEPLKLRVVQLPATQLLQLRAALSTSAPSEGGESNIGDAALALASRPNLLAEPVQRARDHVLGRTRAAALQRGIAAASPSLWSRLWPSSASSRRAAPASAAAAASNAVPPPPPSLLDTVQSAAQRATYRFWTVTGLSTSLALYGRVVDVLTTTDTTIATTSWLLPSFLPSTSLAVFLLGTTVALFRLQRDHARLARRVVKRDLVERVPLNVKAELEALVRREVGEEGVWRARREVGRELERWVKGEREKVGVGRRLREGRGE